MDARQPAPQTLGDASFDALTGELAIDGEVRRLRPQSAAVLAHLLSRAGQLVTREELLDAVWGQAVVTENSLAQCLSEIRRALGPERLSWLETHARRGYALHLPAEAARSVPPMPAAPVAANVSRRPVTVRVALAAGIAALLVPAAILLLDRHTSEPVGQISLAVMPFAVPGGGAEATALADVVGEDLTFNLARIPGARVVSRASTQGYAAHGADLRLVARELDIRYAVVGSLERQADRLTLRLQLIEVENGTLRWSERTDATLAELHLTERRIAERVAHALHMTLVEAASGRASRAAPAHPAATDLAVQAWAAWNRGTPTEVALARKLAEQALALDARNVMAWKTMASWHLRARLNLSIPPADAEAGAEAAADRAMALDPEHPLVHTVWGASRVLRGRYAEGIEALEQEVRSNPSHPVAYSYLAVAHLMTGEPRRAIERLQQALSISPRDPRRSRFERLLAIGMLHVGESAQALKHARAATSAPLVDRSAWAVLAASCLLAGDTACAQEAAARLRQLWPEVSLVKIEQEWPPATPAFDQQHQTYLQALGRALALP